MIIGLRGGHSPNCKGASGYLDEQSCVRELYYKLKPLLEAQGHTVIDCNSNASSVNGELNEGTNKCNANNCDLYIPLHMNASNGQGNGVECWTYSSNSSTANAIGTRVCSNLASLGLQNRGVKHNTGYHDTRAVKGETCLIEVLFCDNKHDCDIWNNAGINKIASLIGSAICNKTVSGSGSSSKPSTPSNSDSTIYGNHYLIKELQQEINDQGFGNISVDGIVGDATLNASPVCKQGARGGITKIIQQMLINIGYPVGSYGADGVFGDGTVTAIKALQKDCNLSVDGIVGRETWKALFRNLK
ncbi:N-acetylmuramoyl-L-alanine amidase [Clostridium sporogenes]|uniref:N-acetylmuramoyl-L-alanine amidase n=1 Tax=Clostridium sporogenes TaxID=1509 RepID=UPI0005F08517|nr:N-acetylmuramoyl-L-alanine amidase [Clostridium sporogenes]MDU5013757.1 N-acetylmuramoyl-L-alanine amidase [Clostridium botulinum]MDU5119617.1 N-acetylmuramoyl-L-alanine amidase [Clostridium botulinum]NFG96041.1 N-acetylmuramoyl-L-alanine amidase [Clostridium sporogenes]